MMSKWEELCDCNQTEWVCGWMNEHVFVCFCFMSVSSSAPYVFFRESSVVPYPRSSRNLHVLYLFTIQNKCPPLHGLEAVASCLGLFLWQQRAGKKIERGNRLLRKGELEPGVSRNLEPTKLMLLGKGMLVLICDWDAMNVDRWRGTRGEKRLSVFASQIFPLTNPGGFACAYLSMCTVLATREHPVAYRDRLWVTPAYTHTHTHTHTARLKNLKMYQTSMDND